jgi:hypothetical protein
MPFTAGARRVRLGKAAGAGVVLWAVPGRWEATMPNRAARLVLTLAGCALATGLLTGLGVAPAHAEPSPSPTTAQASTDPSATPTASATPSPTTTASADPSPSPSATKSPPQPIIIDDFCLLEENYLHSPRCAGYVGPSAPSGQGSGLPFTGDRTATLALLGGIGLAIGTALTRTARSR